jgi:hypothetical protein
MSGNQHLWLQKIVSMHPHYGWMHASHGVMFMDGLHESPRCDGHGWIACKPWFDGHGCMHASHGVMVMDGFHASPRCDGHGCMHASHGAMSAWLT